MQNILIIEDESDIAESLRYNFERAGFKTQVADSGEKGLKIALESDVEHLLILLDLMLPGMSGLDLCRRLKREPKTHRTPIIMLTAKTSEMDKIVGLESGADDYIVKPFSVKEVIARVRAVLRRTNETLVEFYEGEKIAVDFQAMTVSCKGQKIKLTKKEFNLLKNLVKNLGRVATRQSLLDNVWGHNYYGDTRTLDVHIRRLRQKLGECSNSIETIVGIGYRFLG